MQISLFAKPTRINRAASLDAVITMLGSWTKLDGLVITEALNPSYWTHFGRVTSESVVAHHEFQCLL